MLELIDSLLTPANIALVVGALMGIVATLVGTNVVRRRRIALATFHAYHIVKDLADETPGEDALDKVAAALKAADDYMKANGWRPLKEGEKALVSLSVKSLAGQEKIQTAVSQAAQKDTEPASPREPSASMS